MYRLRIDRELSRNGTVRVLSWTDSYILQKLIRGEHIDASTQSTSLLQVHAAQRRPILLGIPWAPKMTRPEDAHVETAVIGTVAHFPTQALAQAAVNDLRMCINQDRDRRRSLMSILVNHAHLYEWLEQGKNPSPLSVKVHNASGLRRSRICYSNSIRVSELWCFWS